MLFHVSLEVINEALHLLHGRLVPGGTADAQAHIFLPCSVASFLQDVNYSRGEGELLPLAVMGMGWLMSLLGALTSTWAGHRVWKGSLPSLPHSGGVHCRENMDTCIESMSHNWG